MTPLPEFDVVRVDDRTIRISVTRDGVTTITEAVAEGQTWSHEALCQAVTSCLVVPACPDHRLLIARQGRFYGSLRWLVFFRRELHPARPRIDVRGGLLLSIAGHTVGATIRRRP
jgi:hypothetical protein